MKAVQMGKYGGPKVLEIVEEKEPKPSKNQIAVLIHAAGINPYDVKTISGFYKDYISLTSPVILGGDYAGVVVALGDKLTGFKVGDKVFGTARYPKAGSGSYAGFAVASVDSSALMPKSASFEEAAALPVVGCSVVQAIEKYLKLKKGQKILIHGGAGGIGHLAIQLAKSIGAYVATTVSTNDVGFVKKLGADQVIDYQSKDFEKLVENFDAVYDMVGGQTTNKSFNVLKKGGVLVSMLGAPKEKLAKKLDITAIGQGTKTDSKTLIRVAELFDKGKMKVKIDKVFPLEKVREAFTYQAKSSPRGKVVLKVK